MVIRDCINENKDSYISECDKIKGVKECLMIIA